MFLSSRSKGFTLIELLVVISIIALLSSVVLASLNSARSKARDTVRKSDARQIMLAIELYFDANGVYPTAAGATAPNPGWANSSDASWATLATALRPYLPSLPKDPQQSADTSIWGANGAAYSYVNCGRNYMYVYRLENAAGPDAGATCVAVFYQYGGGGANTTVKTMGGSY